MKIIMGENIKQWKAVPAGSGGTSRDLDGGAKGAKSEKNWKEQVAVLKTQNANLKRKAPGGKGDKSDQNPNKKFKGDKKVGNPMTLKTLLNGSNICEGFNKGSCTGNCARTPPELHVCNGKMKNGKKDVACGKKHKSTECTFCLQRS